MERLEDNTNKDELELHHVIIQVKTLKNLVIFNFWLTVQKYVEVYGLKM